MNETYQLIKPPKPTGDTKHQIHKFWDNIVNFNVEYIGYGWLQALIQSTTKNRIQGTLLCITGEAWSIGMIEALLKYKADPEIKNRLDIFPCTMHGHTEAHVSI